MEESQKKVAFYEMAIQALINHTTQEAIIELWQKGLAKKIPKTEGFGHHIEYETDLQKHVETRFNALKPLLEMQVITPEQIEKSVRFFSNWIPQAHK